MPCDTPTPCPTCNPDYTELGCPDYPHSGCIIYDGEDIPCLNIEQTENLNEVLQHIKDVVCSLTPAGYASFDFSCFTSQNITTEKQFAEFISSLLCSILGTQTPNTVTSLSTLYTSIQTLTTDLNLVKNQNLLSCFQTLTGLSSPQQISQLLTAIQTVLCDHETRLDNLESGSINTNITVVNTNHDVIIAASGINNHTLSADVKIDPDSSNSITTSVAGILSVSPSITVVDTPSINFTASGTKGHTLTGDVKISSTANNAASILSDGIYVNPASITETALVANDSTSINFIQSGVNGHTVTANVILNPSGTNLIQSTGSGLLVNSSLIQDPITPINTNSINLTISGTNSHTIKADAIVSPTINNQLQILADGLYVNPSFATTDSWLLAGNSNATSLSFVGTTTNIALNFKVNNLKSGKIDSSGQTLFGYKAGFVNSAVLCTAIGYQALLLNTTGSENVAVGSNALSANVTGFDNVAVGSQSLQESTFNYNTAVGHRSLQLVNGTANTGLGTFSGKPVTPAEVLIGDNNIFIGFNTEYSSANISNSVVLGTNAIVSASNNFVVGGTGSDKLSVVVGGTAAVTSAVVDVNSTTQGLLPPRMTTTQKNAIASPAEGLVVYDITLHKLCCYDGTVWQNAW